MKKLISIVTPCYNEEDNVEELFRRVETVFNTQLPHYDFEHIFIDNASTDKTVEKLKAMALTDARVKLIINSRNFGHVRSPLYGLLQASGDAVISVVADLQDPPEMIPSFIEKWEEGNDIVLAIKKDSEENKIVFRIRKFYYNLLSRLSEVKIFKNYTGFGLYNRNVMDALRTFQDPYPFFRGMIAEVGFKVAELAYNQPVREKGITKNNFYSLYDMGILGIMNNSKVPLRLVVFLGFILSSISALVGLGYLIAKIIYWNEMKLGMAPLVIGGAFAFSMMIFFLGIIGEYIGAIYTQVLNRPLVFEKDRINF